MPKLHLFTYRKLPFLHCLLSFLWFASATNAQQPNYFKSYGANYGEQGNAVAITNEGIVATALQLSDPQGGGAVYPGLLLTDEAGERITCKKYPQIGWPGRATHVHPNHQGFLVTGISSSGSWMMQTDSMANPVWTKYMFPSNVLYFTDVEEIDDGYLLVGTSQPTVSSAPQLVCVKLDTAAQVVWAKTFGTTNYHISNAHVAMVNDQVFIAATGKINLNFTSVFLMKLDANAQPLWTKHFETTYDDELAELLTDDAGRLYMIGRNYQINTAWDAFVIQTDTSGNVIASKHYDGNGDERVRCATMIDGNTLALSFDFGGSGDRSPAIASIEVDDLSINWCRNYVYEWMFTNYLLDMTVTPDKGLLFVGDMHVTGKIRDTYLVRTDNQGIAGCHNGNYLLDEVPYSFTDTIMYDTAFDLNITPQLFTHVAEEAWEIIEFTLCSNVLPQPEFTATLSGTEVCEQACYVFEDATQDQVFSYEWAFEGGTPSSHSGPVPPEVCWTSNGNYAVTLTVNNSDGTNTTSKTIQVDLQCTPSLPNVFSPNGDGLNDTYIVQHLPADFQLDIYNRWGQLVFSTSKNDEMWNGVSRIHDSDAPEGVYYVVLEDLTDQTTYSTPVQLVR